MTKSISVIVIAITMTIVSCGPSAEEKAWVEEQQKHITDSIAASTNATNEASIENGNETIVAADGSTITPTETKK